MNNKLYKVFDDKTKASVVSNAELKNNVTTASSANVTDRLAHYPGTYESQRPYDAMPSTFKEIVKACRTAYLQVGVVRNVVDLMTDFACEDLKFVHPDKKTEAFFRVWAQKVKLNDVTSEFVRHSLIDANVVIKRHTAKINKPIESEWSVNAKPDTKLYKEKNTVSPKEIPIRYTFINILSLDYKTDENDIQNNKKKLVFKVNPRVLTKIRDTSSSLYQNLYKNAPDVVEVLKNKDSYDLDMTKIYVSHNKKDSWDDWAPPFLYSTLSDIHFKSKLRQAEVAALDGVINVIRIWKLGDHKEKILPTDAAVDRLIGILENNTGGGAVDIVWDTMIDMKDYYPPVKDILGSEKYEQVNKDILVDLGIPEVLLGGGEGANFSNSFIQLKTIVERLKAIRNQVSAWLNHEIGLICKAMDFKIAPKVFFGEMNLDDENVNKKLVIELLDRGAISLEAVLSMCGQDFLIEMERKQQEKDMGVKLKSPFDEAPKPVNKPDGESAQKGRPPNSKDTIKRQRKNIKIRTSAGLMIKALDYIDMIDEHIIPHYMETINVSNARKLTNQQKDDIDNLRILILSCIKPEENITKDVLFDKLDNLTSANKDVYSYIKDKINEFISTNNEEPTLSQRKRIQAISWVENFLDSETIEV